MDATQIDMIQGSFKKVVPISDAAADIFYSRLFEVAPEVKPMFKGELKEQGKKLMTTLGAVVNGLKNLDAIVPVAQQLAVKHVDYGVQPDHYPVVGETLIYTLEKGLGEDFTPELRNAWVAAYGTLSSVMIDAAYPTTSVVTPDPSQKKVW
ncbi:globin family protein [Actibacterium lipolyticum]|uniref:Bacterial hemoglobin n=1 Tax=Actibacterium lipolyticum TaxID=1524263 RepID=A0A238JJN8_9RHOB|nr:globin family protein [Actibacterium lipolyticum]SMX30695.1 Bacterial hemoglobin [Actibacterium lipolyticum]